MESKVEKYLEFLWKDTHEVRERLWQEAGKNREKARENSHKWFQQYKKKHKLKIGVPEGWTPPKLNIPS